MSDHTPEQGVAEERAPQDREAQHREPQYRAPGEPTAVVRTLENRR